MAKIEDALLEQSAEDREVFVDAFSREGIQSIEDVAHLLGSERDADEMVKLLLPDKEISYFRTIAF